MAIQTRSEGTLRDNQRKAYVDSPQRGENFSAQEVVVGNTAADPIPVIVDLQDNLEFDVADGAVSAVKAIYKKVNGVSLANSNVDYAQATVIGISINAANDAETVRYKTAGRLEDSSFSFTVGVPLYLDINGNLTETPPTNGFRTRIGSALEVGAINIQIEEPIIL